MGKIVFLGDSLTASANVSLTDRWTYKVGIAAGYAPADVINAGISGNRSDQMLARIQADALSLSPDVLVLMLTVNDRVNAVTLADHESNYRSMISQAQAAGVKVVMMSPPLYTQNLDLWKPWVEKGEQLAGETRCHYIDCWREYTYASYYRSDWYQYLYVDYVHQTAAGNALIFSIAQRATHNGAFVKAVLESECPALDELTLAMADLQKSGATKESLQRVLLALTPS